MRNARKKRKRRRHITKSAPPTDEYKEKATILQSELEKERKRIEIAESKVGVYKSMSRSYWERWRWELQKRKEAVMECKKLQCYGRSSQYSTGTSTYIHQINPSSLTDIDVMTTPYIARGSFSLVKVQKYRDILVAVKEYLPRTISDDVFHEARLLSSLCHPFVVCLLGICLSQKPYCLVTQFEGVIVDGIPKLLTLFVVLHDKHQCSVITTVREWLIIGVQLMEALRYLHYDAGVLHNDIKTDNILLSNSSTSDSKYQAVLVDFGKATYLTEAKRLTLSDHEQIEYTRKYTHLAPEIISGEAKQSIFSDIFSAGGILYKIVDNKKLDGDRHIRNSVHEYAGKCRSVIYHKRPNARDVLAYLQNLLPEL